MSLAVGIVGLPNVGKSTLFKALTKKQAEASNYPFTTIDPNVGIVEVPDERLSKLAACSQSAKIIPTTVEFVDIAGLVKGAHKGEGLGNAFLANIREVDAIVHVVRAFDDPGVIHVAGSPDPKRDQEIIELELILADLEVVLKAYKNAEPKVRTGEKAFILELAALTKIKTALESQKPASTAELTEDERKSIASLNLLTLKPVLTVFNVDEADAAKGDHRIAISAKIESEIVELEPDESRAYLADLGLKQSGLDRLIAESYRLLDLITFFTSGPKETRAWTVRRGAKAPQAAGKIHSDFERGFIRAEIVNWKDLVTAGSEANAKAKGLIRTEGKEYVMQDGDTALFRFSV